MADDYYKILGLDKHANLADVKKAFRKRAKVLHPDINQEPDAQERFIVLHEAYEYLNNLKTGKVYSQIKRSYTRPKSRYKNYDDWHEKEREKVRQRARNHARMQYEAFTESNYYKTTRSLHTILDGLSLLLPLFIFIIPIIAYFIKGITGLIGGIVVIFVTTPLLANILVHNRPKLTFKEFGDSFAHVIRTRTFLLIIASAINLFLFFQIGLSTLVNMWTLISVFAISMVLGYLLSMILRNKLRKKLTYLVLAPGIVNILLLLNFFITTNETTESYSFKNEFQFTDRGWQKTSQITLHGDKYSNYIGIRIFMDYEAMKDSRTIEYNFADGIIGFRVLKSYEFK